MTYYGARRSSYKLFFFNEKMSMRKFVMVILGDGGDKLSKVSFPYKLLYYNIPKNLSMKYSD